MTQANGSYVATPIGNVQQNGPLGNYTAPSLAPPTQQFNQGRGICTLSHPNVGTLQFRTNPNSITWDYSLITHTEQTYGGRVVQILGVKMDNLVVKVDCGQGGWNYAMYVVQFMRDMMVQQRNGGAAGTFSYTTRNWKLKVFALNVPFHDAVEETIRELKLEFNVQEDVSGVQVAASLSQALQALQDGIGWAASGFNQIDPAAGAFPDNANGGGAATALQNTVAPNAAVAASGAPNPAGIPGFNNILGPLTNLIPGL